MRDPNRIPELLATLGAIWTYCPDMRLGQIIVNATGHTGDMFHYEDDEMLEKLQQFLALCQQREQPRT